MSITKKITHVLVTRTLFLLRDSRPQTRTSSLHEPRLDLTRDVGHLRIGRIVLVELESLQPHPTIAGLLSPGADGRRNVHGRRIFDLLSMVNGLEVAITGPHVTRESCKWWWHVAQCWGRRWGRRTRRRCSWGRGTGGTYSGAGGTLLGRRRRQRMGSSAVEYEIRMIYVILKCVDIPGSVLEFFDLAEQLLLSRG